MSNAPAAHVRHELRTPLNHIIGYSELLLEEAGERGRAELAPGLHRILDDARALLGLINDLLATSKFGARVAALRQMPAELATPLNRIVATCESLQPQIAAADAADLAPDLERIARAARHFLTLVRDGVGPAVAGGFAEDAPRVAADAPAAEHGAILVVDDNETNRDMLSRRLARQGYQVHLVAGGRQAFELLETQAVDLILLDVMMPEMNGYDALQRLKANPAQRDIPVLMISALDEMDSVVRCIELGAEDYLFKPFDPVLLRARIGACLEKKRLRDEIARHVRRMERELELARAIQLSMVPTDFSIAGPQGLELYATLQPAYEVGGDLYDFFWMTPERMCLVVADVSDKGASAALFMARAKTVIRLLATNFDRAAGRAPTAAELVVRIDAELCQDNPYSMFVTLLLCIVDARTGGIEWCNAGHNPPYLIAPDGAITQLARDNGIPIGIDAEFSRVTETVQLASGGSLFAYTDGVSESMNEENGMFGTDRLEAVLRSCGGHTPQDVVNAMLRHVQTFAGSAAASDDITMLVCRWRG